MRRRAFALPAVLSALLCAATCLLWVRSYWVDDVVEYVYRDPTPGSILTCSRQVNSSNGSISIRISRYWWEQDYPAGRGLNYCSYNPDKWDSAQNKCLGFGYESSHTGSEYQQTASFPHWCAALIFSIPAGAYTFAVLRIRKRRKAGNCLVCGYDLRATPGRCPECGTETVHYDGAAAGRTINQPTDTFPSSYLQRLRVWESDYGRSSGWDLELDGRKVAFMDEPQSEEMFWISYRLTVTTDDPALAERLMSESFWKNEDCSRLIFRSRAVGLIAGNAFPSIRPFVGPQRINMRALYIPIADPLPLDWLILWIRRRMR